MSSELTKVNFGSNSHLFRFQASSTVKFTHDTNALNKEITDIKNSLVQKEETREAKEKIFFDMCHISPIKMHLSFSLSNADAFKGNLVMDNPFFKSIGAVLTDIQDVVFK